MTTASKNYSAEIMVSNNFCGTRFCFQGFFALLFLLIGIVCNTQSLQGQDTTVAQVPKQPYSFDHAVGEQIATQTFSLTPEEVEKARKYSRYQDLNMSRDIAIKIESDIRDIGTWENLPNGDRLWRYKVHLTNAKGVGFRFPATDMPKGAFLFYYNTEKSCLIGPFTNKMPITTNAIVGQDAVIEYYEPAAVKGKLNIHSVLYRFADFPPTFLQNLPLPPPPIINQPISEAYLKEVYELFQKDGNKGGSLMENFKHDLNDIGRWDELPNGDRIWRVQITMKFAVNVELGISKCKIPEGCQLFRYDLNRQNIKQNYTSKFREEWFWIGGKDVILEYYETAKQKGKSILQFSTIDCTPYLGGVFDNSRDEDNCSPNVLCADAAFTADVYDGPAITTSLVADMTNEITDVKQSVIHLKTAFPCNEETLFNDISGTECKTYPGTTTLMYKFGSNCTGTLLCNNAGETYVLSARHCVTVFPYTNKVVMPDLLSAEEQEVLWRYDFNFETISDASNGNLCDYTTSIVDEESDDSVKKAAKIVAVSNSIAGCYGIDYLLLKIPPVSWERNPYYAGFDASETLPLRGFGIHHPLGYNKKFSLQDDALSNLSAADKLKYDGIKRYNNCTFGSGVDYLDELTEDTGGGMFAFTYDRGSVLSGSSGSAYFNPGGLVIGQLNGGPIDCASGSLTSTNWNNNKVARYGRLWYEWDRVYTGPSSAPIKITDDAGNILPSTTDEQKKATLKPWIDPKNYSNGMLQGFLPNNCNDVYLKDGWPDVGNEPNEECSTAGWDNIWESPDFYPFHAGAGNIPTDQWVADNSANFTSIDFSSADNNYQYDNYIFYRVRNKGNCTSGGGWLNSALYMYYTIGSTGEVWEDSWINNQENGCVLGDQITIYAAGDENNSDPYEFEPIVPLQIDGEFSNFVKWYPPNFSDPNDLTRPYQDLGVCTGQLPAIEDDYKWEICLLARYKALDDPMFDEKEGINSENTTNNIISNNNIVTHNTFFFDPYQQGGGINPIIVSHGHPSAVFVANNNNEVKHLNILLDKISAGSQEALEQLLKVEIIPSEKIWQRWTETGQKGEGVQVVSDRLIRITNLETAKLLDIPFDPNDKEPIAIKVTILLPEAGKKALLNNLPNMYKVLLTHEAFDPNEEIRKPTACIFQLNDLQKYGETEIDYQTPLLNIVPNPVQNSAQINYFLPAENNTHVSLHLYDTQGRLIKNLLPTSNSTGGWQTIWVETETLPTGVYIVQLKTQIGSIVQKMIKM